MGGASRWPRGTDDGSGELVVVAVGDRVAAGDEGVQAAELGRYGVTANAIAPSARTRMTETVFADMMAAPTESGAFDAMSPDNVAPLVVWLGSSESAHVTGRVFELEGGKVSIADGWQHGSAIDKGAR